MLFENNRVHFLFLFLSLSEAFMITRHFKANQEFNNKLLMHTLLESRHVGSLIRCASLCDNRCRCLNFNSLSGMCRLYSSCDPSDTTISEAGWTYSNSHRNQWVCILKITKYIKFKLVNVLIRINPKVLEADKIILFFKQMVFFQKGKSIWKYKYHFKLPDGDIDKQIILL